MVGVGNGTCLNIKNFGSSIVQYSFPSHPQFLLKDVLHCLNASAIFSPSTNFALITIVGLP
jgi:hypothetical protein